MTLARKNILAALVLALPVAAIATLAAGWIERRDRTALLERIAQAHMGEVTRDACASYPQWFLAGARPNRPRPEEQLQPDADVRLPRPSPDPLPYEFFAYDDAFSPSSVAGPRFPDEFRRRMRTSPPDRIVSGRYANALGSGVQTAIATPWTPGPCSVILFRQLDPPGSITVRAGFFAGVLLLSALVAWLVATPTAARIRRLSKEAKESTRDDYAAMVQVTGKDEISALGAIFNESAADIRRKTTGIHDREEALRRYAEVTTEDVAPPLAALTSHLAELGAGGDPRVNHAVREAHRLTMALQNQGAVTRLRAVNDSSPRDAVDLAEVVKTLGASRLALARACDVTLDTSRATTRTVVNADAALMTQAIANLIDNAIIYNRPGGSVRVELVSYDHGKRFRLVVADTGLGVSDEDFAGLTANKRFRGDEARTRRPGSRGLGLALAREIADRFGMQLDLRQPEGGGFEAEIATRDR
jgi:signal transduction histidine kinase